MIILKVKKIIKIILKSIFPFYRKSLQRIVQLETQIRTTGIINPNINIESIYNKLLDYKLKYEKPKLGSANWLIISEYKYGGLAKEVKRKKVSILDPRTKEKIATGGMVGGDRMNEIKHHYSPVYSSHLKPWIESKSEKVLVEIGILKGVGIALWSDLFKNARIIGLDIDLSHIMNNMENLKTRGAFKNNNVELYEFDQFLDNKKVLFEILNGDKVDIIIDDGVHLDSAIINTIESFLPYLQDNFIYIIEDNKTVYKKIIKKYPDFYVTNYGEITIINRG